MADISKLRFCTYNCRSVKNSMPEVHSLCNKFDIVLLQEHWLLPNELHTLNNIHPDFHSYGMSAVDISRNILVGRPYGGTAILFRKCDVDKIKLIENLESRITGIVIDTNKGPLALFNVYMPTNYGDECSLELYTECLSKLHVLMVDTDAAHTVIAGDFNCSPGSRFFNEYVSFAVDNNLVMSDLNRLNNVFTYISDDGSKMSWVDHILCSTSVDNLLENVVILNDVIGSDHKPVSFNLACHVHVPNIVVGESSISWQSTPMWHNCDNTTLVYYESHLDSLLQYVSVPHEAIIGNSTYEDAKLSIDTFYANILSCVSKAVNDVIPMRKSRHAEFNIPGWNTYVKEKHEAARDAFLIWLDAGKPKFGHYFDVMKRTRAVFKLALRFCRNNIEQLKADACAESLYDKDATKFWKNVYKISNNKTSSHAISVNGASGPQDVAEMWKVHFENLYRSSVTSEFRALFDNKIEDYQLSHYNSVISFTDVYEAVTKLKCGKASGPDGLHSEAFMYGGRRLCLYISILFNLFIAYGYVPDTFHLAAIIPLVKCKNGDLSDVDNYRAIAISNSMSKILESVLYNFVQSSDVADDYQFGFKRKQSCSTSTYVLKQTVNYYRQNGSHVFACFIDFSKAFDNVDYWLLFCKLLDHDSSIACRLSVRLLAYWYSHQQLYVRWQSCTSGCFNIEKGVRQGGVLSPFLFNFYIRALIDKVTKLNVGCNIAGTMINLLAYADDIVLLAPSWRGLQTLLKVVEAAVNDIKMTFNTKKTVCMIFNPCNKRDVVSDDFPALVLAGCDLEFVDHFKYLGHIIDNKLVDDKDINRELKSLFMRTNMLSRRFNRCNMQVKVKLFQSFCICFYDAGLWCNYTNGAYSKLTSAYNRCVKLFFGFDKYCSVTNMFLQLGLPSFNTLMYNYRFSFAHRVTSSDNSLLQCVHKLP
jgi:exonuclease III